MYTDREMSQEREIKQSITETVSKIKSVKILKLIEGFVLSGYREDKVLFDKEVSHEVRK